MFTDKRSRVKNQTSHYKGISSLYTLLVFIRFSSICTADHKDLSFSKRNGMARKGHGEELKDVFAKISNIDVFLKILPFTEFVLERTCYSNDHLHALSLFTLVLSALLMHNVACDFMCPVRIRRSN